MSICAIFIILCVDVLLLEGMDAQPFFDEVEADQVDLILITHFHIDHCAALPYFTEKTNFKVGCLAESYSCFMFIIRSRWKRSGLIDGFFVWLCSGKGIHDTCH